MEGLKIRIAFAAALLVVVGLLVLCAPSAKPQGRTEAWMEQMAPKSAGAYRFVPGSRNPQQTIPMDAKSYELLEPFGIVERVYRLTSRDFEVVLIASNNRSSFHDPRVCFAGQGFNFDDQHLIAVPTRTRGTINMAYLEGQDSNGRRQLAAYVYKGPGGFSSSTLGIKWRLFKKLLLDPAGGPGEAVFYRFVTMDPTTRQEEFVKFIADYMDSANDSSQGYF